MRPGPHPWATNDTYAGGPDIGSDNKSETGTTHRADGYYRGWRPSPDVLNWQLNREHLSRQNTARMMAANSRINVTTALLAGQTMDGSCCVQVAPYNVCCYYFFDGVNAINELTCTDGLGCAAPASNPITGAAGAVTAVDADADDSTGDRVIVAVSAVADRVFFANGFGGGAWALSATGAPGTNWTAVASDRDTAAGANPRWLIGDDTTATGNGEIYTSVNGGANFAVVATFPNIAEPIIYIGHTCHPVGALGTDDPGNPSWLVLTTTQACVSADGVTWSQAAHGFGVAPSGPKCCAYSRTAGRGVFANTNDIWYSDDNGATWTAMANALSTVVPTNPMQVKCDGYGTFAVIGDASDRLYYVSVDDGITWTTVSHNPAAGGWGGPPNDTVELEVGWYSGNDFDTVPVGTTYFMSLFNDQGAPLQEPYVSLHY